MIDDTHTNKKEVKKIDVNKIYKRDFYLKVFSDLKNGIMPIDICLKYSKSKSALQYDLNKLKKAGLIRKIGYGTWEIIGDFSEKEVKNLIEKSKSNTSMDLKSFFDKSNKGSKKFKKHLEEHNLLKCLFCERVDVQIHHLRPRMILEDDSFENLIPLCKDHHELIHAGGLSKEMNEKINIFKEKVSGIKIKNKIRGHAFIFTLKVPKLFNWKKRELYLKKKKIGFIESNKGQKIIIDEYKIFLYDKRIVIFFPRGTSILENSAINSKKKALEDAMEVTYKLERLLNLSFRINKCYKIKVVKQHYAELKNELAEDFNKQNKKLHIRDEEGYWLLIDDSHNMNLNELETIDSKKADKDMDDIIKPFFNSLRQKPFTAYDFENLFKMTKISAEQIGTFAEQQGAYAEEIKKHREAIAQMTSVMKKIETFLNSTSQK